MVVVGVTVMRIHAMFLIRKVQLGFWHVCVVTIRLAFIAMNANRAMNRRNGDKIQKHVHSNANVRQPFLFEHLSLAKEWLNIISNISFAIQHVIVTAIRTLANMTKRPIVKGYRWTYMADMKVVVYAKIVNTIQKASIVINANRNTIDHTENIGTKPMCADVSNLH